MTDRFVPTPGNPFRLADMVPMRDRLLVAPLPVPSRSRGGIHLAETGHQRERPQHGIVLVVGPGVWTAAKDARVPLQLHPGDCVFYGKYSGQEFELDGQRVLNMSEAEVFSVLPVGTFELVEHENGKDNHLRGDYCEHPACVPAEELEARARLAEARAAAASERGIDRVVGRIAAEADQRLGATERV